MIWLALGFMSLLAAAILALPLFLTRKWKNDSRSPLAFYRDQLSELARDEKAGLISPASAKAAQIEIAKRISAIEEAPEFKPARAPATPILAVMAVLLPLTALGLYLHWGSPFLPGAVPASALALSPGEDPALAAEIKPLLEKLAQAPEDGKSWRDLGGLYLKAGKGAEAAAAYAKTIALGGADAGGVDAGLYSAYGQALVLAEGGAVTPPASASFAKALERDPEEAMARFFLALERAQTDDLKGALADWLALERDSPEDAPWMPILIQHIEKAAKALGLDPASLADRKALIAQEIADLEARLAENGEALADWLKLARAYRAIGEDRKAKEALGQAARLAPKRLDVQIDYADALIAGREENEIGLPEGFPETVERIRALDPENPLGLYYGGLVARAQGKPDLARTLWRKVLERMPADAPERRVLEADIEALGP